MNHYLESYNPDELVQFAVSIVPSYFDGDSNTDAHSKEDIAKRWQEKAIVDKILLTLSSSTTDTLYFQTTAANAAKTAQFLAKQELSVSVILHQPEFDDFYPDDDAEAFFAQDQYGYYPDYNDYNNYYQQQGYPYYQNFAYNPPYYNNDQFYNEYQDYYQEPYQDNHHLQRNGNHNNDYTGYNKNKKNSKK